jgi:GR25 family glycosyltransferase involved in LPS biosynthesis
MQLSVSLANDCLQAAKSRGYDASLVEGVNGFYADEKFQQYGITTFLNKTAKNSPGRRGCFLSHFELWKKCVELNEPILILEHDGLIIRDLPNNVLDTFSDILNLDPYRSDIGYDAKVKKSIDIQVSITHPVFKKTSLCGECIIGAYGYIIKPSGATKLIDHAINVGILPTDKYIGTDIVDIKTTNVPAVRLHPFFASRSIKDNSSTKDLGKYLKEPK